MPTAISLLGMDGYEVVDMTGFRPVILEVRYKKAINCPFCNSSNLRKKDKYIRKLRHESIGERFCFIHLEARKYLCHDCGKYFNQRFPGIGKYRKSTEGFRRQIIYQHQNGISQKQLSRREKIGSATVERWFKELVKKKAHESSADPCPQILGIDEHFFTKKKGYATTFCDLGKRKVFDVVLGRSEASLSTYLDRLRGKDNVKMVCIDLSSTYRSIIKKHFPNAKIVADLFHVIRIINHHFLETWKSIDPVGRANRGLLSLMRRNEENLKPEQKVNLKNYFDDHPGLEAIYDFKQKLCRLLKLKSRNHDQVKRLAPKLFRYIDQLKSSKLPALVQLGKTLFNWKDEIARMWRFTKNNAITEGFHNKMEMISRRAFGFRNFENYRLRVKMLCA